jgi:hypothetical protein
MEMQRRDPLDARVASVRPFDDHEVGGVAAELAALKWV